MAEPTTPNIALIVPNTGDLAGSWGSAAVNPDFLAIDGYFGGVQTISASNAPITLTAPAGSITPSGGPTQAQNAVLRFTGALTAGVRVTLPLPGVYVIENLTTGSFVLSFQGVTATEVIGTPQGSRKRIYNDGSNVRFVTDASPGTQELWSGLSSIPAWVTACTVPPYLYCDGTIYNSVTFPFLSNIYGSLFGGNGSTTFGVPDLRGRIPIAYDGTGTRITTAGSGLNGQVVGASIDSQSVAITAAQVPTLLASGSNLIGVTGQSNRGDIAAGSSTSTTPGGGFGFNTPTSFSQIGITASGTNTINVATTNTGGLGHPNVQPSQITGIWVVKT